MKNEFLDLLHQ